MEHGRSNGGSGCQTFILIDKVLVKYNGNDEYVRLPGYIFVVGSGSFKNNQTVKGVSLPDTAKKICTGAFSDCVALERVELPYGLTEIGDLAFSGCTFLHEIVFRGMKERWLEIKKGDKWLEDTGDFIICCKDGVVTKQEEKDIEAQPKVDLTDLLSEIEPKEEDTDNIQILPFVRRCNSFIPPANVVAKAEAEDNENTKRENNLFSAERNNLNEEELRRKVLKFFIKKGRATTSLAQDEFKISYIKARDLIEWMKSMGYVKPLGEYSVAPCKVLISLEDFKKIFGDKDDTTETGKSIGQADGRGGVTTKAVAGSLLEKLQHIEAAKCVAATLARIAEKKMKEKITAENKPSHSLWNNDEEEFEREVLLRIRKFVLSNFKMARRGAIKLAETYLEAVRDTHDGRIMQVYETIVYELKSLSDKSYIEIRKYMQKGL